MMYAFIDISNYEAALLDQSEGNLSKKESEMLRAFLIAHPQLQPESDLSDFPKLSASEKKLFSEKEKLIKPRINNKTYIDFLVASIEGELNAGDSAELKKFLKTNEQARKDSEIFRKTILVPDSEIVFINKNVLLKGAVIRSLAWQRFAAVAATLLLLMGLYMLLQWNSKSEEIHIPLAAVTTAIDSVNVKSNESSTPAENDSSSIEKEKSINKPEPKKYTSPLQRMRNPMAERHPDKLIPASSNDGHQLFVKNESLPTILHAVVLENEMYKPVSEFQMISSQTDSLENIALADSETEEQEEDNQPALLKRILSAANSFVHHTSKNRKQDDEETTESFWNIASASSESLRILTGRKISITRTPSADESSERISFVAGPFEFATDKEK